MKQAISRYIFSLLLLSSFSLQAQSLYDDARALVAARETLELSGYSLSDSASVEALAKVMAILYSYDNPMGAGDAGRARLEKVPGHYRGNPGIAGLLPLDVLMQLPDSLQAPFLETFQQESDLMEAAPRQKMVDLLRGDYGSSPADYLSVSKALRKYSVPPLESNITLEELASESNQNVVNGIVNPQAVIEGLFQFVLQRAQEEVVMNFMERFLTQDLPQYAELFPTVVTQFNQPGFSYSGSFLQRLRDAFYEDLQLLSVRFPQILLSDERFQYVQNDPLMYNLLAVYSIIGMTQNEAQLEEILPITFRNLFESYLQNEKKLNLTVAANAPEESEDYRRLILLSDTCLQLIQAVFSDLDDAQSDILREIAALDQEGFPVPESVLLLEPAYDLGMIMGRDTAAGFRLNLLPAMLGGHLDTSYILGFREVYAYDKFFSEDFSPEQWKAAGLELARNLSGDAWFADAPIDQLLRAWTNDLNTFRQAFDTWKRSLSPEMEIPLAFQKLENSRQELAATIKATREFWGDRLTGYQPLALVMLDTIISGTFDPEDIGNQIRMASLGENAILQDSARYGGLNEEEAMQLGVELFLQECTQKLLEVESRFILLNDRVAANYPGQQTGNPVHQYLMAKKSIHPFTETLAKIDVLKSGLQSMQTQLGALDKMHASTEVQIMENARPILGLTESLTHLMYCLRTGGDSAKWITKFQLDSVLNEPALKDAFLGLLYQRLSRVQHIPKLSPEGLANLVQLTVADLPNLFYPTLPDSLKWEEGMNFYYPASFFVNTLNRVLEIPLIVDPTAPDLVKPLAETHPSLATVPGISELVLDLIYYLNARDHRHAISTAIRLFLLVENLDVKDSVHEFLQEYGFFIADLIDAETGDEVQSLLNGIADPPGSSRLKRTERLTVGLNAYLGGSVGQESWQTSQNTQTEQFVSIAPTMPIGITFSGLIGNGPRPPSFSLFLSFLDLGSMLSFRGDESAFGENKITYKNMFKPSLQIHYNIPKSPFYIGLGGQIGPHYRDLNGEELSVRTNRLFFNFGVDVPVKTLFVR